jgi:hypothetical protein
MIHWIEWFDLHIKHLLENKNYIFRVSKLSVTELLVP